MSEELGVADVQTEASATSEEPEQAASPAPQSFSGEEGSPAHETDKEVSGIRDDLIAKRRENSYLKKEIATLKSAILEIKSSLQPREPEIEDDAILTAGEFKKMLAKERDSRMQNDFRSEFSRNLADVQKNGDFEQKMAFLDELIESDPEFSGLDEFLLSRANGPKIAYKLATQLMAEQKQKKTGQVSQKLDRNLSAPPPMTGGSASPILDEARRIAELDPRGEEFNRMVRKVEGYLG